MSAAVLSREEASTVPAARRFFKESLAAFNRAASAGRVTQNVLLGGGRLAIVYGSDALAALLAPIFAHLPAAPADDGAPDFTIHAWDSACTGVPMPAPPWAPGDYGPSGEIHPPDWPATLRARFNLHAGVLSMADATRRTALWWTRDAAQLPDYERGAPFLHLLHWWRLLCPPAAGSPACVVHAAAVGTAAGGGLLLAGKGGSGKSTTALACLAAGFAYAGDDHCLLQPAGPEPRVASLYASGKLTDAMLARFPGFAPAVLNPDRASGDKALLGLAGGEFRDRLVAGLPLRAIVLPRVCRERAETRLLPASPAAALRALAPSTLFLFHPLAGEGATLLARVTQAARRLPCFHLELGADADARRTPEILANLLTKL